MCPKYFSSTALNTLQACEATQAGNSFSQLPYLSILEFDTIKIPDITCITGVNGSGKSHLLDAIKKGFILFKDENEDIIQPKDITLYNYSNFNAKNDHLDISQQKGQGKTKQEVQSIVDSLKRIHKNYSSIAKTSESICQKQNKSFIELTKEDFGDGMQADFESYKNEFQNDQNIKKVLSRLQLLKFAPSGDVAIKYLRDFYSSLLNEDVLSSLGQIYRDFYKAYLKSEYFYMKDQELRGDELKEKLKVDYPDMPWAIFDLLLKQHSINIRFSNPETNRLDLENIGSFLLSVYKENTDTNFSPSNLSSGERIIIALFVWHYNCNLSIVKTDKKPKLLLLDEIDAVLNPGLTKMLLSLIRLLCKQHGVKVILTTHSPLMAATMAKENCLYYLAKNKGKHCVIKENAKVARYILEEGFYSAVERDDYQPIIHALSISHVLLVEGRTDKEILEQAYKKLYGSAIPFKIETLIENNSDRGGHNALERFLALFHTHCKSQDSTHHKIIGLFDFDIGYESWDKLRHQLDKELENDPERCLVRGDMSKDIYAMLLPVHDEIKDNVIWIHKSPNSSSTKTYQNKYGTYGKNSTHYMELMFYGCDGTDNFFEGNIELAGTPIVPRNKKEIQEWARGDVVDKNCFKNFEVLFDKIHEIFEVASKEVNLGDQTTIA